MASKRTPYKRFDSDQLILRDQLAIDRTLMANDRTFLSYVRTSLALVATGAAVVHFLEGWIIVGGLMFGAVGIIVFMVGYLKYKKMNEDIKRAE